MLSALSIRDIVLIDKLDLDFSRGLSALTGETGAGKSILLDSLALAIGARGDAGLTRAGAEMGQVTAVFELQKNHTVFDALKEFGVEADGQTLILRRQQTADGRTRAFINDQPVSAQALKVAGSLLVEIHGQHDDRILVDSRTHRNLLDAYGELGVEKDTVRNAWRKWQDDRRAFEDLLAQLTEARRQADYLRHASEELVKLNPGAGEETALADRRQVLMNAEKIMAELREAYDMLDGSASPIPNLNAVLRKLERKASSMPQLLNPGVGELSKAIGALNEAHAAFEAALREADHDPHSLEKIEERLFSLRAMSRKYQVPVDELNALAERYAKEVTLLDHSEEQLNALQKACTEGEAIYLKAAEKLSSSRKKVATKLDKAVMAELAPLKLERARFMTEFEPQAPGEEGVDQVSFHVQTNPGTLPGPLMKIASGGELARFMLALKVVLADAGSAPTLIFDEIDTGVGGAVAEAVGLRLARLATKVQVLCVTHSPQVAAKADAHLHIAKEPLTKNRVATRVAVLDAARRREEIARMLSGAKVTDEARAQARKLLGYGT
jgi:DNA repair protein RecN (Recombination protein N)